MMNYTRTRARYIFHKQSPSGTKTTAVTTPPGPTMTVQMPAAEHRPPHWSLPQSRLGAASAIMASERRVACTSRTVSTRTSTPLSRGSGRAFSPNQTAASGRQRRSRLRYRGASEFSDVTDGGLRAEQTVSGGTHLGEGPTRPSASGLP